MAATVHTTDTAGVPTSVRAKLVGTGGALVTAALGLGGYVTSEGPNRTGELGVDVTLSEHRFTPLVEVAQGINVGLGPAVGPILVAVVAVWLFLRHRTAAVVFAVTTAVLWVAASAMKVLFDRPRPDAATVHALVHETAADSYPSGHTAFAAAIMAGAFFAARSLGHTGRRIVLIGAPLVLLVAFSRLYLGAHFVGDVTGSLLFVGGLTALGVAALPARLVRTAVRLGK